MDTDKTNQMVASLISKRQRIQDQISKKREFVLKQQEDIANFEEQIQDIDSNIANIKARASKESEKQQQVKKVFPKKNEGNPISDVEEDASITVGGLDSAGVIGDTISGKSDFGGWKHYTKVGDVLRRTTRKKKKNKKKQIDEYINSFCELIEGGE